MSTRPSVRFIRTSKGQHRESVAAKLACTALAHGIEGVSAPPHMPGVEWARLTHTDLDFRQMREALQVFADTWAGDTLTGERMEFGAVIDTHKPGPIGGV